MTGDRRSSARCPTCQGPAVPDNHHPEGVRCRNSSCRHNHFKAKCPRCGAKDVAQASWKNQLWSYTCADCEHTWSQSESS